MNSETENHNPEIKLLQEKLSTVPPRNRRLVAQGRSRFLTQAVALRDTHRLPWFNRIFSLGSLNRKENFVMFATIIVILAFLFSGTGMTAYAAQDSTPGETLYPVKLWTEDIRLSLTSDPQSRFYLLDNFTAIRFDELSGLMEAGLPVDEAFLNRMLTQIDQMLDIAAGLSDEDLEDSLDHLRIRLMDQDRLSWPENDSGYGEVLRLREEITIRNRLTDTGIEDPVKFRLELQNRTRYSQPTDLPPTAPVNTPPGYGPGEPGGIVTTPGAPMEPGYGEPTQMNPGPGGSGDGSGNGSGGKP